MVNDKVPLSGHKVINHYIKSGYKSKVDSYGVGYPEKATENTRSSLRAAAIRFFNRKDVIKYIADFKKRVCEKIEVNEAEILKGVIEIAESNLVNIFCIDKTDKSYDYEEIKHFIDWPDKLQRAVQSFELCPLSGKVIKVKLWSKDLAQEKLFKYLGLYERDNKQKTSVVHSLNNLPENIQDRILAKITMMQEDNNNEKITH